MEDFENKPQDNQPKAIVKGTDHEIAMRAKSIRSHLMLGRGRKEICQLDAITIKQYRTALSWYANGWNDNREAFGNFAMGEQNRLEAIQRKINEIDSEACLASHIEKAKAIRGLHALAHDIRVNILEIGLKLGILQREVIRIQELPRVEVGFGDENATPWFENGRKDLPIIESVN